MKTLPKTILVLSLFTLSACAGSKTTDSSGSSSNGGGASSSESGASSASDTVTPGENANDTFVEEERIDITVDFDSQSEEDFSSIVNAVDVSTIEDGGTKTISDGGTYLITGTNANAKILVNSEGEVKLILDGVSLANSSDAPLEVKAASSFTLHVASKTKNYLSDGVSSAGDGALVCNKKVALNIEGSGYLYLTSSKDVDEEVGAAIKSPKGVSIQDTHIIASATGHAIQAKGGASIEGAKLYLDAGKDGIHAEEGEVILKDSVIDASTYGDGIDSTLAVTLDNVTSHFVSTGVYVLYNASDDADGTLYEDSRYILENGQYKKIDSDSMSRYSSRYYLNQKCKGVKSEASVTFKGGDHYIKTADDCIASDTGISILSGDYSLYTNDQGLNSDQALTIGESGSSSALDIRIYHCYEGIQGGVIHFYSGYTYIYAEDDGINATSDTLTSGISMNFHDGATVYANAEGDGVDSNGDITMDGGSLIVAGPSSGGNGSLDFDGSFTFTGGNLLAVGSNSMTQVPNTSSVNALSYSTSSWSAGSTYSLYCGDEEFSIVLPKSLSSVSFIVQSPSLTTGSSIEVVKGATVGKAMRNGVYFGDKASAGGSSLVTGTIKSGLTTIGNSSNHPGGGQGGPGGR